jgi:hypothetical protein
MALELFPNQADQPQFPAEAVIPQGTAMLFPQGAAPVGWTKSVAHNDKTLRIVSGTGGGSAGSNPFTNVFTNTVGTTSVSPGPTDQIITNTTDVSTGLTGATALDVSQIPSHVHNMGRVAGGINNLQFIGGAGGMADISPDTAATGGGGAHQHTQFHVHGMTHQHTHTVQHAHSIQLNVQYVDCIICTKD